MYVYTGTTGAGADTKTDPVRAAEIEGWINKLLAKPTEFVYSDGYLYGGTLHSRPIGFYWSASVYSATNSRYLYFNTGGTARNLDSQNSSHKGYAFAVRCVGAGSGTVPTVSGSICPTNWSLPDFTDQVGVEKGTAPSYNNLTAAYGIVKDTKTGVDDILAIPLSFPRSGDFYDGVLNFRSGSGGGYYWSPRPSSDTYAYLLDFYSTTAIYQGNLSRCGGRSVRCVVDFKSSKIMM